MPPQPQVQMRAAGDAIAPESIPALHQDMKPVWVTCIVLPGWRTGMHNFIMLKFFHFYSPVVGPFI